MNCGSMLHHARMILSVVTIVGLFAFQGASAQESSRKLKNRVDPVYPDLARRNNIYGSARVELLITADGRVKNVKVLGGNPVLVDAVVTAVMKWKYEPAPEESSVVVKFDFAL